MSETNDSQDIHKMMVDTGIIEEYVSPKLAKGIKPELDALTDLDMIMLSRVKHERGLISDLPKLGSILVRTISAETVMQDKPHKWYIEMAKLVLEAM